MQHCRQAVRISKPLLLLSPPLAAELPGLLYSMYPRVHTTNRLPFPRSITRVPLILSDLTATELFYYPVQRCQPTARALYWMEQTISSSIVLLLMYPAVLMAGALC